MAKPTNLKTFDDTQADPAHCKSASFAAAGPNASHTGLFKFGTTNYGPTGFTAQQKAQIAARQRAKNEKLVRGN